MKLVLEGIIVAPSVPDKLVESKMFSFLDWFYEQDWGYYGPLDPLLSACKFKVMEHAFELV